MLPKWGTADGLKFHIIPSLAMKLLTWSLLPVSGANVNNSFNSLLAFLKLIAQSLTILESFPRRETNLLRGVKNVLFDKSMILSEQLQ